jgi:hypothetical protein
MYIHRGFGSISALYFMFYIVHYPVFVYCNDASLMLLIDSHSHAKKNTPAQDKRWQDLCIK